MTQPRDYRETGQALAANIQAMIENHPDSFECDLYEAIPSQVETVAPGVDVVGTLESEERSISYKTPVEIRAILVPAPELALLGVTVDGAEADGYMDAPVVLRLSAPKVPEQSIIKYFEYIDDDEVKEVLLYVQSSVAIGKAPGAGLLHYCLPYQAFDDVTGAP